MSENKPDILIRSYGRRRAKGMRPTRTHALDEVLPQVQIALLEGDAPLDPASFFKGKTKEVWFEIGFGNGEHLLRQAIDNPDIGLIGCEPFINGVAALCVGIKKNGVQNIRVWPEDARVLMARLKPQSIDRLYLLHPDPWPKARHHKRRFIQTETLDEIARLLKPGAELRMATDHVELAEWLLEKASAHPAFTGGIADAADWPETRYRKKGLRQGRPPVHFIFTCRRL